MKPAGDNIYTYSVWYPFNKHGAFGALVADSGKDSTSGCPDKGQYNTGGPSPTGSGFPCFTARLRHPGYLHHRSVLLY